MSNLESETRSVLPLDLLDLLLPFVSTLSFTSAIVELIGVAAAISASFLSVSRGVFNYDRTDSMSLIVSASMYGFLKKSGSKSDYALPFGLFRGTLPSPSALI